MTDSQHPVDTRGQPHLRLTPEQVLENWRQRFYTPPGYLYHLILALRREGWWYRINNVAQFCRDWEINRRTFYRAKAELITRGLLEEHIIGSLDLRVPNVSQIDSPVSELSPLVPDLSQPVTPVTHMAAETQSGQRLQNPTDLSQIFFRSSLKERESAEFSTGNPEDDQETFCSPPATVPPGQKDPPLQRHPPEKISSSAAEDDPEFFDWVLTYKIPRLPNKPASPRSVAAGWIRKHRVQLYAEYQTWLQGQHRGISADPQPPPLPPPRAESPAERLQRYQQLWQTPICRNGIRKVIEDNPDWNLTIGPNGPQEVNHADD